jgi:hypothetical protein
VELKEEANERPLLFLRREDIETITSPAGFHFGKFYPPVTAALKEAEDFVRRQMMPLLFRYPVHIILILSRWLLIGHVIILIL